MYAFSDLHGNYNLWKQIEQFLIDNKAYAICLGDVVARGPQGWKIFKEVIDSPYVITFLLVLLFPDIIYIRSLEVLTILYFT